jgi:uncharacterized protein YndB with AHSA1/START domain
MSTSEKNVITVEATVNAPVEKVWDAWNESEHVKKWCFASDDWHMPSAEHEFKVGGKFKNRMEAKDGSFGFDLEGTYLVITTSKFVEYAMADGRHVKITFTALGNTTTVTEAFEAESENPIEMQQAGWQAILNNFKKYTETLYPFS